MVLAAPCTFQCLKFLGNQRKTLWNPGKRVNGAERRRRWTSTRAAASGSDSDLSRLIEAAKLTVDTYIKSGMVVGLGSGRASGMVIRYLGQQLREGALKDIVGVPTSVSSASEAAKAGIPLNHFADSSQIDFAFDDADVIEEGTLNAIIGRQKLEGYESILKEKSIVKAAGKRAFIVSEEQYTKDFDGSIPVLVNPVNWMETAEEIDDLFLGDAEVWRRPTTEHAGPLGAQVAESLDGIEGVVDHGVIFGVPCTAVIASKDGLQIVDNVLKDAVM